MTAGNVADAARFGAQESWQEPDSGTSRDAGADRFPSAAPRPP